MFIHPGIAQDILRQLIEAQDAGKPITLARANENWGRGSTWEDLVDGRFIERWPDRGVLVTKRGRDWYTERVPVTSRRESKDDDSVGAGVVISVVAEIFDDVAGAIADNIGAIFDL